CLRIESVSMHLTSLQRHCEYSISEGFDCATSIGRCQFSTAETSVKTVPSIQLAGILLNITQRVFRFCRGYQLMPVLCLFDRYLPAEIFARTCAHEAPCFC